MSAESGDVLLTAALRLRQCRHRGLPLPSGGASGWGFAWRRWDLVAPRVGESVGGSRLRPPVRCQPRCPPGRGCLPRWQCRRWGAARGGDGRAGGSLWDGGVEVVASLEVPRAQNVAQNRREVCW